MGQETEIKLRWNGSVAEVEALLLRHGYSIRTPRELEADQIYDRNGDELRSSDRLLRVRRAGERCVLTYKGPAQRAPHKSREEIETNVSDGDALVLIIQALGFLPTFRYEKYRTIFEKSGVDGVVTLDETPIGTFLELEGAADWIDETARTLGFGVGDYITFSYARLYADYRRSRPGVPPDMRF